MFRYQPPGLDFLPLWTAGRMAWSAPGQVYDFAAVTHAQAWLFQSYGWVRPYAYPPTALLLFAPLGRLPFWLALGAWMSLSVGLFLFAGARLAGGRLRPAIALLALAPPVVLAVLAGQTVLLAAALMTLGVVELGWRPRLAGLLLGLAAALKPQAVLLAPIALLAGGSIEALVWAGLVEVVLVGASVVCFGAARWSEWLACLPAFERVIQQLPHSGVITPFGVAHDLGLTGAAAVLWRGAFALYGAVLVWRTFRGRDDPRQRLAALAAGGLLVTPYAMHYDGTLMVPASVAIAVTSIAQRDWILRMLALLAVCEVTAPNVGLISIVAFSVLALLRPRQAQLAATKPSSAAPSATVSA